MAQMVIQFQTLDEGDGARFAAATGAEVTPAQQFGGGALVTGILEFSRDNLGKVLGFLSATTSARRGKLSIQGIEGQRVDLDGYNAAEVKELLADPGLKAIIDRIGAPE